MRKALSSSTLRVSLSKCSKCSPIITTSLLFYPIHVAAALPLVPYLGWVSFGTALNLAVRRLNSLASLQA
ncbi:MAG: tryptophan-rich sensory protein [Pseudomonadota bacterium]